MMRLEFFVPGIAKTAGSKSAFKHPHTGKIIVTHANKGTKDWMDTVKYCAMQVTNRMCLITEPIKLTLVFFKERPKGHLGTGKNAGKLKASAPVHPTTKPDLTKLTRAVEDALTGVVWKDDAQVVQQETRKMYCGLTGLVKPGVQVVIETLG